MDKLNNIFRDLAGVKMPIVNSASSDPAVNFQYNFNLSLLILKITISTPDLNTNETAIFYTNETRDF